MTDLAPRVTFTVTVPLPCKPPTPNARLHHMARARLVKQIRDVVALVVRSERNRLGVQPAFTKRHLSLTLFTPKPYRRLDPDNLVAACKAIVDGCRDAALILDDRAALVDVDYAQEQGQLAVRIAASTAWPKW